MSEHEFEQYLKSFQPRQPDELPRTALKRRWWIASSAIAACLTIGILSSPVGKRSSPVIAGLEFTIGSANALLVADTPWDRVLNESTFRYRMPLQNSAIELLGKERLPQ